MSKDLFSGQSAMEYLMTYGWAILIIAVILGVLFSLGVFNPVNYAPKVPAGNCHVFRPNGPGTSFNVNLVGTCSGFLPQYVAYFNGQDSLINASYSALLQPSVFTLTAWVKFLPTNSLYPFIGFSGTGLPSIALDTTNNDDVLIYMGASNYRYFSPSNPVNIDDGNWHFVAFEVPGNTIGDVANSVMYADGTAQTAVGVYTAGAQSLSTGPFYIGQGYNGYYFKGYLAGIQVYNTTLDANEIQYLYNEGIGGAPIYLSHLVAWWPLNGDTKDYSGNGNNGAATDIAFNGSWATGYSQP